MGNNIIISVLILLSLGFIYSLYHLILLTLSIKGNRLYGLSPTKYPKVFKILDETYKSIAEKENINIYFLDFKYVNKDINSEEYKDKNYTLGQYFSFSYDEKEKIKKIFKCKKDIEKIIEYNFEEFFEDYPERAAKKFNTLHKNSFEYPRIEILNNIKYFDNLHLGKYKTIFHELGHHFAIKYNNDDSEDSANEYAYKLIKENLPDYFKLIFNRFFVGEYAKINSFQKAILFLKFKYNNLFV